MSHQNRRDPLPAGYQFGDAAAPPQKTHRHEYRYDAALDALVCYCGVQIARADIENSAAVWPSTFTCPTHLCPEPCPTCTSYIAAGL